jgi:hypothetical protein
LDYLLPGKTVPFDLQLLANVSSQDVYWSFYVGREFCIPTRSKNVPIPFVDADFDKLDWYHAPSGISSQPGYMSKTFSSTCELSTITKDIMDVV